MHKFLVFGALVAVIFATSAGAQTTKSDAGLPVTFTVGKLQMDKPVRGKMMFTITYRNVSSKVYNIAFSVGAEDSNIDDVMLTIPEFRSVKPDSNGGYFLVIRKFKPGVTKVIHVSMPKMRGGCYGVQLHVEIKPKVVKSSEHKTFGC